MRIWSGCVGIGVLVGLAGGAGPGAHLVKPLSTGPVSYFDQQCSRCHGPFGANYALDSLRKRSLSGLKKEIGSMASGAGQMPISGRDLDAQVAMHQAILKDTPFLSFTKSSGGVLSGEVVGAEKVVLKQGSKSVVPEVSEGIWSARVPGAWLSNGQPILVVAGTKKTVVMDLSKGPTSGEVVAKKR